MNNSGLNILREIFTDSLQRKVIVEALGILEECYDNEDRKALCNGAVQREIGRIQAKINNLIELYTEGEVSKADYRARRDRINTELSEAKSKLVDVNEEKEENVPDKRSELEMIIPEYMIIRWFHYLLDRQHISGSSLLLLL